MVDVPRADQERHLRAIIPEWLTRPPEHEVLLRQRREDEAREAARVALVARREVASRLRAGVGFALAVQVFLTQVALAPLGLAALVGLGLGAVLQWRDEGGFTWAFGGIVVGFNAALWLESPILTMIATCCTGLVGGVVGVLRDPLFRIR